ncbi:MAG: DUF3383 family protein [Methylococcaceae bacterium]|nr:DUF3383 family protein [Methylococcaceae bacterium]
MSLDDIVNVSISVQTLTPSRTGFGIPLITCPFSGIFSDDTGELARAYTTSTAVRTDFGSWHPVYKAALAAFAQNPHPTSIIVGRETNASPQVVVITPTALLKDAYDYTIYVNDVELTFTTTTADAKSIVEGLKKALEDSVDKFDGTNVLSDVITPTEDDLSLTLTAKTDDDVFTYYVLERDILTSENTTPDDDIEKDLGLIIAKNNDWYCLTICNPSSDRVIAAADVIESLVKIQIASSADDAILTDGTSDVAYLLNDGGYARSGIMYHPRANDLYAHARWVGKCLPQDPGSITWKFKQLAGLTTPTLDPTEIVNMRAKNCNFYSTIGGIDMTEEGYSGSGEFLDTTTNVDYLRARMQENVFFVIANAGKIPYTDEGVAMIETPIWQTLKECARKTILTESSLTVTAPLVADISPTDRGNRLLPDVVFTGTLQGAVHSVDISGTVSI